MEPASRPAASTAGAARVLEMARRLGPLPYSAGGPAPPPEPALPAARALVSWQVDAVDAWWAELGRPDPFTLVEVGAGNGTRAKAFLAAGPECLTALRYVLVEDDPDRREQQRTYLPVESPILVLGPVGPDQEDDDGDEQHGRAVEGIGPLVTSLPEPPVVEGTAVVVVIGWLSRLPSDRLEWRDGRWWEIRLAAPNQAETAAGTAAETAAGTAAGSAASTDAGTDAGAEAGSAASTDAGTDASAERDTRPATSAGANPRSGPGPDANDVLSELPVLLDAERARFADQLTGPAPRPEGARYAVLRPAVDWLARTLRVAGTGRLVVVDRWSGLTSPLPPGEVPPLALDQLTSVRRPIEAAPVDLFPELSMVSWRLG
jgi:hypothetical protein